MDTSDTSFTYYNIGEYKNTKGISINKLPVRRKLGNLCQNPKINLGIPFNLMIVEFWNNGKWTKLKRNNAFMLYGK